MGAAGGRTPVNCSYLRSLSVGGATRSITSTSVGNRSCRVDLVHCCCSGSRTRPRKGTVSRDGWRIGIENSQLFVMKTLVVEDDARCG